MDRELIKPVLQALRTSGIFISVLWVIYLVFYFSGADITYWGIIPRKVTGLPGILTAPLIHSGFHHLISNSGPLFLFLAAMLYFYPKTAWRAAIWIWIMTDVWVWIGAIGNGSHLGASGLVYGFASFLFFSGVIRRDMRSISVSLLIALFYGSMVWGVFPGQKGISWESHLYGAVAGLVNAWFMRKHDVVERKKYEWENEPDETEHDENAIWNYRKNWDGSGTYYLPDDHNEQRHPDET